jgi:hypothetical protein
VPHSHSALSMSFQRIHITILDQSRNSQQSQITLIDIYGSLNKDNYGYAHTFSYCISS